MKGASERNGWPLTHDAVQRRADLEEIFQPVLNGMSEQQRAQWGSWYSGPISMPPKVNSRAASGITVHSRQHSDGGATADGTVRSIGAPTEGKQV
jgi:hypothetical protein